MYYLASLEDCSTAPPPPSAPVRDLIKFKFSFDSGHYSPGLYSSLFEIDYPPIETFLELTFREINDYEYAHNMIAEKLRGWPIWGTLTRLGLIEFAMQQAHDAVGSIPPGHSHVYLHVHLAFDDGQFDEEEDFMSEFEVGMIPSDDSSIQELVEKKVVMSTNSETCSICMEELPAGSEAVSMPCSHLFHQDCIVKWLRTSHYCPLTLLSIVSSLIFLDFS